ncbi:hypothetical protein M6B22_11180 [Jatrophihabitans cynanchi]|uniref:SPOR domain-containing protein n=1 Tax=Jatrophihabitans cynanchi TaxID=2944128 RepID=A0ABY7JTV7_9ACTN|nr:hypothetical protein [Jatrophihabitans sp. SB3-54]WAX55123.1 hypothetical protein M6B22_11180 [Jatrophihabitans sp. SB3-54]
MNDEYHTARHERPWIEYRTDADTPWREREFDTVEEAEAWAHQHLGLDVADVGPAQIPEPVEPPLGIGW